MSTTEEIQTQLFQYLRNLNTQLDELYDASDVLDDNHDFLWENPDVEQYLSLLRKRNVPDSDIRTLVKNALSIHPDTFETITQRLELYLQLLATLQTESENATELPISKQEEVQILEEIIETLNKRIDSTPEPKMEHESEVFPAFLQLLGHGKIVQRCLQYQRVLERIPTSEYKERKMVGRLVDNVSYWYASYFPTSDRSQRVFQLRRSIREYLESFTKRK